MPGAVQSRATPSLAGKQFARGRRNLRLNATLLCIVAAFLPESQSHAQALSAEQGVPQQGLRSYDIEAGPLAQVLNRFAQEAGVLLSFDAAALQGRHSGGVRGSHAVGDGFRQLLAGSGLEAIATGKDTYTLRPALPELSGEDRASRNATELKGVLVTAERTKDEVGHDNVYEKDISNLYVDRKYMERYRGVSTGDVFAGMNGVYNTDNRNGSALSPNIRGIQGSGRIPVTVDGTEQSLDVWMAMRGIQNRNYVDQKLFRSIHVEKGPSITRGLKGGLGGSVEIRTIEAADIISDNKNWGLEIKLGTATNSVKPNTTDPFHYAGMDYRDINNAYSTTSIGTPQLNFGDPQGWRRKRNEVSKLNFDDRNAFLSGAYKHDYFDVLAAYSYSSRGNYFAGTKGASKFIQRGANPGTNNYTSTSSFYPQIGKLFESGWEVPLTSARNESVLLKNNWNMANGNKIHLSYSRNKLEFAEMPALLSDWMLWYTETNQFTPDARTRLMYPMPNTEVTQESYRLGYEFKPEGSKLVDLEMSLWRTDSRSKRYQNGDNTYQMPDRDRPWDDWVRCNVLAPELAAQAYECNGLIGATAPQRQPNTDGRYNVVIATEQLGWSERTGFDISNRFQFDNNLKLTVAADYQYERQQERKPDFPAGIDLAGSNKFFGPASGRRKEYGASLNLDWQPASRLQLSAGVRYGSYWSFDDELDHRRQSQEWPARPEKTHQVLRYQRLMSDEELEMASAIWSAPDFQQAWNELMDYQERNNIVDGGLLSPYRDRPTGLKYVGIEKEVPLIDGKADRNQNPFYNGSNDFHETVENPQGLGGTANKYRIYDTSFGAYRLKPATNPWRRPVKRRADAWSGQFVASYALSERSRVYMRFGSMVRFPSLYESASNTYGINEYFAGSTIKPERNEAWEIGYGHNLGGLLQNLELADVKISYFHNTIHNFYDRSTTLESIQFDRKIISGIEFQARADSGRYFGNFGMTYRLRQDMCDKDYAVMLSPYQNRIPACMPGGFSSSLSFTSLQPKYSINLDLGARLLEQKNLEVGARLRYHSRAENKKMDSLLRAGASEAYIYGIRPYYWDPVKLLDLYAEYRFDKNASIRVAAENVTDRYYIDPLSKSPMPGPGRTIMMDVSVNF